MNNTFLLCYFYVNRFCFLYFFIYDLFGICGGMLIAEAKPCELLQMLILCRDMIVCVPVHKDTLIIVLIFIL